MGHLQVARKGPRTLDDSSFPEHSEDLPALPGPEVSGYRMKDDGWLHARCGVALES